MRTARVHLEAILAIEADVPTKAAEPNALDGTTSVMAAAPDLRGLPTVMGDAPPGRPATV